MRADTNPLTLFRFTSSSRRRPGSSFRVTRILPSEKLDPGMRQDDGTNGLAGNGGAR
jgi:hypothetical protein